MAKNIQIAVGTIGYLVTLLNFIAVDIETLIIQNVSVWRPSSAGVQLNQTGSTTHLKQLIDTI